MTTETAAERLMAGKVQLLDTHPYLARALFAISTHPVPGLGTLAVDNKWRLAYDPEILAAWSVPEIAGVLYHEVLHLLRDHAGRAGQRTPAAWNAACDAEINDDLREETFTRGGKAERINLPGKPIYPESLGRQPYLTAEEYYRAALDQAKARSIRNTRQLTPTVGSGQCGSAATGVPEAWEEALGGTSPTRSSASSSGTERTSTDGGQGNSHSDGDGGQDPSGDDSRQTESLSGTHGDTEGVSPVEADIIRRLVAQEVTKSRGTVPGHLARFAESELEPERIDWRRELRSIIARTITTISGAVDYTYTRPSRRQSAVSGVVLPALREPVVRAAVVVDTSGSMSQPELGAALAQINLILKSCGAREGLVVLAVDATVHATKRVFRANEVQLIGGGGTDMRVAIKAAVKLRPRPEVVIVLTDGYTPWPAVPPPGIRVIAGLTGTGANPIPEWIKAIAITS